MNLNSYIKEWAVLCESCENESSEFDHAKKLGYMGNENDVAEWLKGDYAKWKDGVLNTMVQLSNGDESKAEELFNLYTDLFSGGWMYKSANEKMKRLENEIGNTEDGKKLMDDLNAYIKRESDSVSEYYRTHDYTGD